MNVRTRIKTKIWTDLIKSAKLSFSMTNLAICSPMCQNNGICVAPGQCTCPDNFHGPQCQHQKKLCLQKPDLPSNSRISCTPSQCTVTCAKGYRFPDGSTVTNMVCKNGDWTPTKVEWNSVPNCQRKKSQKALSLTLLTV